jgi:tetratricopeptide (TPR) repeat protein
LPPSPIARSNRRAIPASKRTFVFKWLDDERKRTDYEIELERIDRALSELEDHALSLPIDSERATKFVYLKYQRASLAGDLAELAAAETALNTAIRELGPAGDLYFLKANLDFKLHRLAAVRQDENGRGLATSLQGRALKADLDFQEGRYAAARTGYESLIDDDLTWDNLARLAWLKFKMGDVAGAEQSYLDAEDELTAKEMRHYAWVELQRGVLDLKQGHFVEAQAHYQQAERAYSGYWLVEEHMAELLGAQEKFDEAIALYQKVLARVPRPGFQQALGELYLAMGQPAEARHWNEQALAAYLESAQRGDVHYYHHLADLYADVLEDGPEAVKWARLDIELRDNFSTQAALAWALYRAGEFAEALERMEQALSSGVTDAHLFFQAGTIYQAAAGNGKGEHYLQLAARLNPRHQCFHVHR